MTLLFLDLCHSSIPSCMYQTLSQHFTLYSNCNVKDALSGFDCKHFILYQWIHVSNVIKKCYLFTSTSNQCFDLPLPMLFI